MSILCDCNQFLISSLLFNKQENNNVDLNLISQLFIRQMNNYIKQFPTYGRILLCFDNQNYWRKKDFSYYKYSRKVDRELSNTNWGEIFDDINYIKTQLTLKYPVMDVSDAEADDIIACITKYENSQSIKTLIISGDKDFIQLLKLNTVAIFNHQKKILMKNDSYEASLL